MNGGDIYMCVCVYKITIYELLQTVSSLFSLLIFGNLNAFLWSQFKNL